MDYHKQMENIENSPESVESGATINIDSTARSKRNNQFTINPSKRVDSEGMILEE